MSKKANRNSPAAKRGEAMKIIASAEAADQPHMAVAAARDGLTLSQFRALVAGAAPRGRTSALRHRAEARRSAEGAAQ